MKLVSMIDESAVWQNALWMPSWWGDLMGNRNGTVSQGSLAYLA